MQRHSAAERRHNLKKENNTQACGTKRTSIGGQALIEGIMMRGPKISAMAVRNPEGVIVLEKWENETSKRPKICKWPLIRGIFNFVDSMCAGYKALMRSAEIAGLEEETVESQNKEASGSQKTKPTKANKESGTPWYFKHSATLLTFSSEPILPGLILIFSTPASAHLIAIL